MRRLCEASSCISTIRSLDLLFFRIPVIRSWGVRILSPPSPKVNTIYIFSCNFTYMLILTYWYTERTSAGKTSEGVKRIQAASSVRKGNKGWGIERRRIEHTGLFTFYLSPYSFLRLGMGKIQSIDTPRCHASNQGYSPLFLLLNRCH